MPRRTDEEVLAQFLDAQGVSKDEAPGFAIYILRESIAEARKQEPKINHGIHLIDYMNMSEEGVTMEEYYGDDYEWDI